MNLRELIDNLSNPDEDERLFAADDLGASNDAAAVEPLCARLVIEPNRAVREMIMLALRRIDDEVVLQRAVELLASDDPFVRNEMAGLLEWRGEASIPWLLTAQRHGNPDVRKFAIDAGARIPGNGVVELLAGALGDEDVNVVIAAVEYAGLRHCRTLQPQIEELAAKAAAPMLILACAETLNSLKNPPAAEAVSPGTLGGI